MKNLTTGIIGVLLVCCSVGVSHSMQDELVEYLHAWDYFDKGQPEQAKKMIRRFGGQRSNYEGWPLLSAGILSTEGRYHDALKDVSKVRSTIERKYSDVANGRLRVTNDEKDLIEFNYSKVLLISGTARFRMEDWTAARRDLLECSKMPHEEPIPFDKYIGMCFYQEKKYPEAIEHFKRAYQQSSSEDEKNVSAYAVGTLYAIMGNVAQTIEWLRIPLSHDKDMWLNEIRTDDDFATIRNEEEFSKFLRQFED